MSKRSNYISWDEYFMGIALQRKLKEAIEKENYEEAAKIRDKIKELKEE